MHYIAKGAPAPARALLERALTGDSASASELFAEVSPKLRAAARRRAPELAPDLCEEIESETWRLALERGVSAFAASGLDDLPYLFMVLRNAAEIVRSNNPPPGAPSRLRKGEAGKHGAPLSLEAVDFEAKERTQARSEAAQRELVNYLDVDRALSRMPLRVREAACYMLHNDSDLAAAAVTTGFTRQTLTRRLAAIGFAA
jgi:hypothetical protein